MAWTATPKMIVGDLIDAAWMNTYVRNNLNSLGAHAHTGAAGDGSSTLTSLDHADMEQTGSALGEPAAGHVRFAMHTDGTLRFRANGGTEKTASYIGHGH